MAGSELTPVRPSIGACEVVVYTPRHDATAADLSLRQLRRLIAVWGHRTLELGARDEIDYVYVFENKGEQIGVTLNHPHGQVYAYPYVPALIEREVAAAAAHFEDAGSCLWCALLEQETEQRERLVAETETWVAGVPFFARWPYEVHITPRAHVGWLHQLNQRQFDDLARTLKTVMLKYDSLFGFSLPYVMAVHQRPTTAADHSSFHLHFEFYPPNRTETKLKYLAGSEAGAGAFINDTLPEMTAARLRELAPLTTEDVR